MNSNVQGILQAPRRIRSSRPIQAMPLDALRDARRLTQVQLAQLLRISQGAVSKAERRNDMFVSTLRDYVRAIGGNLEIRAVFPEGEVLIDQFNEKRATAPEMSTALRPDTGLPSPGSQVVPEINS